MSHLSGTYSYSFSRLEPMYDNSLKTGCTSLVVGLSCNFSGVDQNDIPVIEGAYIDGTSGFVEYVPTPDFPTSGTTGTTTVPINLSPEYVLDNISGLANEFASGLGWVHTLESQISGKLHTPVRWTDFPYPSGTGDNRYPPVNPDDA